MGEILLLTKTTDWCRKAQKIARDLFGERLIIIEGNLGDPLPANPNAPKIISYLSPWIIPQEWLSAAQLAINFHPGNHHYPGIGCYNFALYENAKNFGSVCHHMLAKVDTGSIIDETDFPVDQHETVESLKQKTMQSMIEQFEKIMQILATQKPLPVTTIQWSREPFTRKQLNDLCRITPNMDADEIKKRVRAVTFPGYQGAYVELGGIKFNATPEQKAG